MGFESIPLIKARFMKNPKQQSQRIEKNKVRSAIMEMCQEYLRNPDDILTFEALPNALDATIEVITEPLLLDRYDFQQYSETLFMVKLREFDIL